MFEKLAQFTSNMNRTIGFDDSQYLESTAVSKLAQEANHGSDTRDEQTRFQKWISD